MKKIILSFTLVAILAGQSSQAATVLAAGDVQIIGYREDPLDGFMFVLWKDIDASTVLRFTDNSFSSATTANTTEGILSWTSGASLSSGTVVKIFGSGATSTTVGEGMQTSTGSSTMSGSMNLATSGDSLYVYQGTLNSGQTPIYAMDFESTAGAASNIGFVPTGLTSGSTAFLFAGTDNGYYSGTRTFTSYGPDTAANLAAAKAAILDSASWTKSADGLGADFATTTGSGFSTTSFVTSVTGYFWNGGVGAWNYTSPNWTLNGTGSATSFVSGSDAWINGGTLTVQDVGVAAGAVGFWGVTNTVMQGGVLTATSISKSGAGTLTINNTNNVQTLVVDNASVSGVGLVNASSGSTVTIASGTATLSIGLGGAGSLTKAGAGELILSGANTYSGQTTVTAGTLTTTGANMLSDTATLRIDNLATFKLGGNETVGNINAAFGSTNNLQGFTLTSGGNNLSATNSALTTGTGGLVKNGTGQMYMSQNLSTYSGGFTLNNGEVLFTSSGAAGAGGVTNSMFGTGTLTLNGGTISSSSPTSGRSIYNNIVLNGNFQSGQTSWGTTNVTMNTNSSGAGAVLLTIGTNASSTTSLIANSTINTLGYTVWEQNISGDYRITKDGTGASSLSNNYLRLAGSNNIAGVTVSSGILGYKNRNSLGTGTLILANGVVVGQDGSINNTATIDADADRTVANNISVLGNVQFGGLGSQSLFSGNVDLNGATRTLTLGNTTTFFGSITNGGLEVQRINTDLATNKSLYLFGANTYSGGTTVIGVADRTNNVQLGLGNNSALGTGSLTFAGGGTNTMRGITLSAGDQNRTITNNIAINSGVTVSVDTITNLVTFNTGVAVTNAVSVNVTLNGVISGAGALIKTNVNTLTLGGANTYSGGTTVNQGALVVNGSVGAVTVNATGSLGGSGTVGAVTLTSGSFLKPGNSPGTLTAASSSWAGGSTYNWEIDNATGTAGVNWDLFSVTGVLDMSALSFSSKMNLVLESLSLANYSTSTSSSWVIAQAGAFTGTGLADGTNVTDLFNITSTAFNGGSAANQPNGGFQVVTGTTGDGLRTLNLLAVPEPSTGALLAFGLGGLVMTRLLRRKQS